MTQPAASTLIRPDSVKICGIRTVEHGMVAARSGAELIGMIFAPARRQVNVETAREISDSVHAEAPDVLMVGVFVDAPIADVNTRASEGGLDLVQLHGDEPPEYLADLEFPAIKAFRAKPDETVDDLRSRIEPYLSTAVRPLAILIDGYDPRAHGGTGVRADWELVRTISDSLDVVVALAGGLTPANVQEAVRTVRPVMVDTSSGVEIDGMKDSDLIRSFVKAADGGFHCSWTGTASR